MLDNRGFDLWAEGYDESVKLSEESNSYPFAGYKEVLNTIYGRIREAGVGKILDIGFGTGVLLKKLYDDGFPVSGIDFSPEMIKIAQRKMPKARLMEYDFSRGLPPELKNEKFDFIICTYAIHHLTDEEKIKFIALLQERLNVNGEILLGDVAFETREELLKCKVESGDDWDDEEIYMVADVLSKVIGGMRFVKISHCSGVVQIKKGALQV